jgi:hypothetical protein
LQARDRDRVGRAYAALFDRFDDPLGSEFTAQSDALQGIERYRLQLWRLPAATSTG